MPLQCPANICQDSTGSGEKGDTAISDDLDRHLPAFPRTMGITLDEARPDLVTATMTVQPEHANRNGVMHGGALLTFADTLGGVAASLNLAGADRTTTLESKTNFLRPVRIGMRITARCEPIHRGRKTEVWQIIVYRDDGKPASVTIQTQMTLQWKRPEG